ncbi:MAG: ribonuclease III [Alphaproteobacteria bacterium]|nr:ribonuclease III [Alphaproteobacteria bacterium]
MRRLAAALSHVFARPDLLDEALTHASAVKRRGRGYERLEFLGDRVLGLILADILLATFPKECEGDIAKRHARLVSRPALVHVARAIDLGAAIRVSKGEDEAGARASEAVLADAMEAVIAALYLDGGLDAARTFITARWKELIEADAAPPRDAKTRLQEWAQARGLGLPTYTETAASGPAHAPQRTIEAKVDGHAPASGSGRSKREAEQAAAAALLAVVAADG